jgi:Zn-dependent protease
VEISPDQVRVALLSVIAFVVSVSVHEFGHAFVADRLGDRTPRLQGRLTLSPIAHIDPIGTLLIPLIGALSPTRFPMLAWGKPVQTNPMNYTSRSPRTGHVLVSLAGPAMNLMLALAGSILFVVLGKAGVLSETVARGLLRYVLALNLSLMFFNLIPLPPLDGSAVLAGILPQSAQPALRQVERYGIFVLFLLFISGALQIVMGPAMRLTELWAMALMRMVAA